MDKCEIRHEDGSLTLLRIKQACLCFHQLLEKLFLFTKKRNVILVTVPLYLSTVNERDQQ